MNKILNKRMIAALTWLCAAVYLVSYITRKNFAAVIAEFVVAEGVAKAEASVVTVALFVCYGIGQLVSGWLGDRISPRYLIFSGLLASSVCNLAVLPVSLLFSDAKMTVLTIIWGLNGFAQAMLWPPMVKIMTDYFTPETYKTSCVKVSWGSASGTITICLIASLFIKIFHSWRSVFIFSTVCGFSMAFFWLISSGKIEKYAKNLHNESVPTETISKTESLPSNKVSAGKLFVISPLILIMLAIIFQGMLRDGIETWMPSYIHDTFGLDTSGSILTSVGLPIFSMISYQVSGFIYRKWIHNEVTCATVLFGCGFACAVLLGFLWQTNVALSAILVMTITATMHGVNLMLICMVPSSYSKYGNVSFISGLLNSCTYVGSAIFTYGVAKISDLFDWQMTIFSWVAVALAGVLCCVVAIVSWRKFKER